MAHQHLCVEVSPVERSFERFSQARGVVRDLPAATETEGLGRCAVSGRARRAQLSRGANRSGEGVHEGLRRLGIAVGVLPFFPRDPAADRRLIMYFQRQLDATRALL